jgi:hypothetical protein
MPMNELIKPGAQAVSKPRPRVDVKKLMDHHLAAFEINDRLTVASRAMDDVLSKSAPGLLILKVDDYHRRLLDEALKVLGDVTLASLDQASKVVSGWIERPPEATVRLLLGVMLDGFRAKPTEGAPIFVDAVVYVLESLAPDSGEALYNVPTYIPAPAIAAAVREAWLKFVFPPSIHEFSELCQRHRWRLMNVKWEIGRIRSKRAKLEEVMKQLQPQGASAAKAANDAADAALKQRVDAEIRELLNRPKNRNTRPALPKLDDEF